MRTALCCITLIALSLSAALGGSAAAREETAPVPEELRTVEGLVSALYETVSFPPGAQPDWERLAAFMCPDAIIGQPAPGTHEMDLYSVAGFIDLFKRDLVAQDLAATGLSERIASCRTERFGNLAHCFVVFEVRTDATAAAPLGRGLDSLQLVQHSGRWWITSIATQFERPGQPLPKAFLEEA